MKSLLCLVLVFIFTCSEGFLFGSSTDPFKNEPVKYLLYTRADSSSETIGKDKDTVEKSNFKSDRPTYFFVHGFMGATWHNYIADLRKAMLAKEDCNFIVVEWAANSLSSSTNKQRALEAGEHIASLITYLHDNFNLKYSDVHVFAHSLGGQVAGAIGRVLTGGKLIKRITGFDPAQEGFNLDDPNDSLGPEDAQFVDVIHTTTTSPKSCGHVDFYVNGGTAGGLSWLRWHEAPMYMYIESLQPTCTFTAYKCDNYKQLLDGSCSSETNVMGHNASKSAALGDLYLTTNQNKPYCKK